MAKCVFTSINLTGCRKKENRKKDKAGEGKRIKKLSKLMVAAFGGSGEIKVQPSF